MTVFQGLVSEQFVTWAHEHHLFVLAWTVNDVKRLNELVGPTWTGSRQRISRFSRPCPKGRRPRPFGRYRTFPTYHPSVPHLCAFASGTTNGPKRRQN